MPLLSQFVSKGKERKETYQSVLPTTGHKAPKKNILGKLRISRPSLSVAGDIFLEGNKTRGRKAANNTFRK